MKKIPTELPVLVVSGTEDPVGNYGEFVKNLVDVYKQNGIKTVELNLQSMSEAVSEIANVEIKAQQPCEDKSEEQAKEQETDNTHEFF